MAGNYEASYKQISRFLAKLPQIDGILQRILLNNAKFIIGDPTIIDRPEAYKTEYVGLVRPDRRGFYTLLFGAPFKGRIIPFHIHTYSPRTISENKSSRNIEHTNALAGICDIIGDLPVIFDREFSYHTLLEDFEVENKFYIIRLNTGNHVGFTDSNGNKIELTIGHGQTKIWNNVYYKGKTKVNVAARWSKGFKKPMFIVTNMENSQNALELYFERMKIEESFRDFKSRIGLAKIMSKKESNMQKLFFIAMLAYLVLAIAGEIIRDNYFPQRKKRFYSGIFIILNSTNYGIEVPVNKLREIILSFFKNEIWLLFKPDYS